jgi:hypothetical protein
MLDLPHLEETMKAEIYGAAYEQANSELRNIFEQLDQLGRRKGQIEKLVETLKPMIGSQSQGNVGFAASDLGQQSADVFKSQWNQPEAVLSVV